MPIFQSHNIVKYYITFKNKKFIIINLSYKMEHLTTNEQ